MDHAARGAAALSSGDALTAVSAYTQALIQHPSSPDYFIQRSTAFTRLKDPLQPQHVLSLTDAEYAVLLGQKRAKREKIQAAQQRRVIALFSLHQYGNAAFILGTMERWRTKEKKDKMEGDMWKAKIGQKLNALPEDDPAAQVTVKEYPERELLNDSTMKTLLQAQLRADGTFRFVDESEVEANVDRKPDIKSSETATSSEDSPKGGNQVDHATAVPPVLGQPPPEASTQASQPSCKIRHEWFQNSQNITVTLYVKGVPKDKAEIEINENSIFVSSPHPSNPASTFTFTLDPLFGLIDAAASRSSIMSTKIELTLRKKVSGQKWKSLEGSAPMEEVSKSAQDPSAKAAVLSPLVDSAPKKPAETIPSYPTSSRSGPKNWDKLASDLTAKKKSSRKHKGPEEDKANNTEGAESDHERGDDDADSDYGGDPVDGFFKKLYAGADDDTRRAMMKSYQESGGTALSTDWKDVGKRRVDPVEPKND